VSELDAAVPPDARRCVPVRVADVPLQQRVDAARQFAGDFLESADERMALLGLALDPGELVAWVAPPRPTFTNGTRKGPVLTRDEVEQIFDLHEQGVSYSAIGERLGRRLSTVKVTGSLGREEALRRLQAREDEELARPIRAMLSERLAGWEPFRTTGNGHAGAAQKSLEKSRIRRRPTSVVG
jgi:hypothetical protein